MQNYNLRFNDAMIHTLMSILAGDFTFTLVGGLAWHLKLRKLDPGVNVAALASGKGYRAVIEESYLALKDGRRVSDVKGLLWLIMSVDQEVVVEEDETHVRQSFVIADGGPSPFAHRVLPPLLEVLDKPILATPRGERFRLRASLAHTMRSRDRPTGTCRPLIRVSHPLVFRAVTKEKALLPGPFERWCGRGDLNPHTLSGTRS